MGILNDMTGRSLGRNGSAKRRVAIVASVALLVPACLLGLLYASGPDKYVATGTFYYWFHGLEQTAGRGEWGGPDPLALFKERLWNRRPEGFRKTVWAEFLRSRKYDDRQAWPLFEEAYDSVVIAHNKTAFTWGDFFVTADDPVVAVDVANAYMNSLSELELKLLDEGRDCGIGYHARWCSHKLNEYREIEGQFADCSDSGKQTKLRAKLMAIRGRIDASERAIAELRQIDNRTNTMFKVMRTAEIPTETLRVTDRQRLQRLRSEFESLWTGPASDDYGRWQGERKAARLRARMRLPCYRPTSSESNELARAMRCVSDAYEKGRPEALREAVRNVPGLVTNVELAVMADLKHPFCKLFRANFLTGQELQKFDAVGDFEAFAGVNVEMARFLGRLEVERGAHSGFLMQIDRNTLKRLRQYRAQFMRDGKAELAERAGRYIDEWLEQIEAEDGFTRSYMWDQARLQLACVYEGGMTEEQLLKYVRGRANGLISNGYTPKWLDEFTLENIKAVAETLP